MKTYGTPLSSGEGKQRGSRAGPEVTFDEAALHGGVQAVGHREGGRLRDAG